MCRRKVVRMTGDELVCREVSVEVVKGSIGVMRCYYILLINHSI